nr:SiaC family regulatory phosphoprotein [Dickeya sp. NCPPB 3274]
MHVSLPYFNSSSTKMLFSLFNILDQAAQQQLPIALHWYYDQEDDIAEEFGQELHIDFSALEFHPHILE